MPRPGKRWRHVTISTYASWLPGDERGWRSKGHKRHSSGDYKHRPPEDEHAGLHRYSGEISGQAIIIPRRCRALVGRTLIEKLRALRHEVLAVSVSGMHAHLLVELPDDTAAIRKIIGLSKAAASYAIHADLPGRVWARDGGWKPVDTPGHQREVYGYILRQPAAWAWSYREDEEPAQTRFGLSAGLGACRYDEGEC